MASTRVDLKRASICFADGYLLHCAPLRVNSMKKVRKQGTKSYVNFDQRLNSFDWDRVNFNVCCPSFPERNFKFHAEQLSK